MSMHTTRRRFLAGTGLAAAATGLSGLGIPAFAQGKPKLRFSAVFSEQDIRAERAAERNGGDRGLKGRCLHGRGCHGGLPGTGPGRALFYI